MRKGYYKSARSAELEAAEEEVRYTPEEWARRKNNFLKFWRACEPRCKRAKACMGDQPEACFDRFWSATPLPQKQSLRMAIKARAAGASVADAIKAGNEAEAACLKEQAQHASVAAPAPTPPSDERAQATSQPPMPQVRML
jgi:hypothetical protein